MRSRIVKVKESIIYGKFNPLIYNMKPRDIDTK